MTAVFKVNNRNSEISVWKGEGKMIYSCEDHVEIALDEVVDEYGTFPVLTKIDVDNSSTPCEYCQNNAVYVVANK